MLVIGNELGALDSLNLITQKKNYRFFFNNLIPMNGFPIRQINSNHIDGIFFGSSNGTLGLLNKNLKKIIKNKNVGDTDLTAFQIFKNGNIIAFYTNYIRIWEKYKNLYFFSRKKFICNKTFKYVFVSKSENFFLSTSFFENQIYLWSISGNRIILGGRNELKELIVSMKGMKDDIFTIGTHTGSIYIYSIKGELIRSIKKNSQKINPGKPELQKSVAWLDKNTLISGKSSGKIEIFDLRSSKSISYLVGHCCEVSNLDTSGDKPGSIPFLLASSDVSGQLKLWDIRNKKEIFFQKRFISKITSISFF